MPAEVISSFWRLIFSNDTSTLFLPVFEGLFKKEFFTANTIRWVFINRLSRQDLKFKATFVKTDKIFFG